MLTVCVRTNLLIQMLAPLAVLLQKALHTIIVADRYNRRMMSLVQLPFIVVVSCMRHIVLCHLEKRLMALEISEAEYKKRKAQYIDALL